MQISTESQLDKCVCRSHFAINKPHNKPGGKNPIRDKVTQTGCNGSSLDGLVTAPEVTELALTATGPKLVPKTLELLLLLRTSMRLDAPVALLSRKAKLSLTTPEPLL